MERLLKIVEGPMRGAEIALVGGTRIKVGRGDDCDIVVADASLPETAFELDVADAAVTLILPDGTAQEMRPFEIHAFGTTSVAIGPADGAWEELRPAKRETPAETSAKPAAEPSAESAAKPAQEQVAEDKKRSWPWFGIGCLGVILLILILCALLWLFRSPVVRQTTQVVQPTLSLRELAAEHGLSYAERDGHPVLSGNFSHRTERLAIRALALAADRHCGLELSDDETLAGSADALLFTVTEGALKLFAATNRTVTVAGYAPSASALWAALAALRADVPWVSEVDVGAVRVGGPVPMEHRDSSFAVSGILAGARLETGAAMGAATNLATNIATNAATNLVTNAAEEPEDPDIKISDVNGKILPQNMFPVAGILTHPYPCVVMRDGHRVLEGGQLGAYTVVRIAADAIELKQGKGKASWKP